MVGRGVLGLKKIYLSLSLSLPGIEILDPWVGFLESINVGPI